MTRKAAGNSSYKKLAVQWLNKALCFVSSSLLTDSFVLRNRQLLVAANRYFSYDIGHHLHKKEFYINPTDVVPSLKDLEDVFGEIKLPKL